MSISKIRNFFPSAMLLNNKGFTLIELLIGIIMVVLITCIGGLILSSCLVPPVGEYNGEACFISADGLIVYNLVCLPDSGKIGGVCSGLGYKFGFNPVYARLCFVGVCVLGGAGILGYAILWLFLENAKTPDNFNARIRGLG